jgi:hypothetical protein
LDNVIVPKAEDFPADFPQSSVPHIVIADTAMLAAIASTTSRASTQAKSTI